MAADRSDILQPLLRRNIAMLMAWRGLRHARALAEAMGLPENQVGNKVSGRRRWQLEDLPVLANTLGVELSDLLLPPGRLAARIADIEAATGTESNRSDTPPTGLPIRGHTDTYAGREVPAARKDADVLPFRPRHAVAGQTVSTVAQSVS